MGGRSLYRRAQVGAQGLCGVHGIGIALPVEGSQLFHIALHPADGDGPLRCQDEDPALALQGLQLLAQLVVGQIHPVRSPGEFRPAAVDPLCRGLLLGLFPEIPVPGADDHDFLKALVQGPAEGNATGAASVQAGDPLYIHHRGHKGHGGRGLGGGIDIARPPLPEDRLPGAAVGGLHHKPALGIQKPGGVQRLDGLIDGIRSVLEPDRVDLHVFLTDNKFYYERRCLETVAHQNFQGFIVDGVKASILSPNLDCYKELYRRKIPVIFYNNFYKNLRCPRVIINDRDCARQLLARLIDAGHKNIAGIFFYDNYASVEKFQGMAEAMQERGLEMKDHYIKWCISDEARQDSYVRSIEKFLKGLPKCTAIVCCNYIVYRHVRNALDRMGKQIPADYSLVCFDYSADTYRQEGVTCSVEQGFEMGRQVALRLMQMIENRDCDDKDYTAVLKPILYDGNSIRNR